MNVVDKVLAGDKAAFLEIVETHGPAVRAYFAGRVADATIIDDLAQETFIAVYQQLAKYDPSRDLGGWIFGIARNRLRLYYRRTASKQKAMSELRMRMLAEFADSADVAGSNAAGQIAALRECLTKLPENAARIIHGRYYDGATVTELAATLETTVSAISSTLHRVRRTLKYCMQGADT